MQRGRQNQFGGEKSVGGGVERIPISVSKAESPTGMAESRTSERCRAGREFESNGVRGLGRRKEGYFGTVGEGGEMDAAESRVAEEMKVVGVDGFNPVRKSGRNVLARHDEHVRDASGGKGVGIVVRFGIREW